MTWWPRQGTSEWVQYDFVPPRRVSSVSVYWFDDTPHGGCALPAAWRVRYWDGDEWRAVANAQSGPIAKDVFNSTTFDAVVTQSLRLKVDLQPDRSGGILEWTVEESDEP